MIPDPDDMRALARSSPWLWRTIHLRAQGARWGEVEAWLARPGLMVVRTGGEWHRQDHTVGAGTALFGWSAGEPATPPRVEHLWIGDVPAPRRPDGLVIERPDNGPAADGAYVLLDADDPMWQDYAWVAMLDPVELSHDVMLTEVEVASVRGRDTWVATMRSEADYDPRCSCCALLWDRTSAPRLREEEGWPGRPGETPASAHRVGLDVATGIVTTLRPLDGDRHDLAFEVEILEVDGEVRHALASAADAEATRARVARPTGPGWSAYGGGDPA